MHLRRQLAAAGLCLAAAFAAPVQAGAPILHVTEDAIGPQPLYLPFLARTVAAGHDVSVSAVEVVQGVSMSPAYTVRVAGRPALLRVFVKVSGEASVEGVNARLTHYRDGEVQGQLIAGPLALAVGAAGQGDFAHTLNFNLPAAWVTEDSAYVVELDPHNTLPETNETNNRYPAAGEEPYHFVSLARLDVVIVPVTYMRPGGNVTTPPLDDLSYLTWMPERVMPLGEINYTVRSVPLVFTGDLRTAAGWSELLVAVDAIRAAEDPGWNKVYYGLVDTAGAEPCQLVCYSGLGYVNSAGRTVYKTAVGFAGYPGNRDAASPTFTHEMGHNFGRRHAPCAGPSNVDPQYPYGSASIGQWGYDLATGQVKSPGYKDYMSYCGPEWTSDYTYHGIAQAWGWLNSPVTGGAASAADGTLVVSGQIAADGSLVVEPVFAGFAPPQLLLGAPSHRLELVDASGRVLSTTPFEVADLQFEVEDGAGTPASGAHADVESGDQAASFRVAVEPVPGLAGFRIYAGSTLLFERMATGPAPELDGSLQVQAGTAQAWQAAAGPAGHYRVRYSPDGGATWHLLASNATSPSVEIPTVLLVGATASLLEVQVSDGVRTNVQLFPLKVN